MTLPIRRLLRAGVVAAALVPAAAAAEKFTFDIAPGKFEEHCLKIDAGRTIRYRFAAGAAVDFNIHHHRGREVLYPVKRDGVARMRSRFRAPASDDYCLMWTNNGNASVALRGEVSR